MEKLYTKQQIEQHIYEDNKIKLFMRMSIIFYITGAIFTFYYLLFDLIDYILAVSLIILFTLQAYIFLKIYSRILEIN